MSIKAGRFSNRHQRWLRWFGVLWVLFGIVVLTGCSSLFKTGSLVGSCRQVGNGVGRAYEVEELGGSAVVYQPATGYQRVRWRLVGNRDIWRLDLYDVMGFRLLRLARLASSRYLLQDRNGKIDSDSWIGLWQDRGLSEAVSESLIKELWRCLSVEYQGDTVTVRLDHRQYQLADGWWLSVVSRKWYPELSRYYPNRLRMWYGDTSIQLLVNMKLRTSDRK